MAELRKQVLVVRDEGEARIRLQGEEERAGLAAEVESYRVAMGEVKHQTTPQPLRHNTRIILVVIP